MSRRKKPRLRKAKKPRVEDRLAQYLTELKLPFKQQARIGRYKVDFLVANRFIVEAYGDYFHANPKKYAADYWNKVLKLFAQEKWDRDKAREQDLKRQGFPMLILWENEIDYHGAYCKRRINERVKQLLSAPPSAS